MSKSTQPTILLKNINHEQIVKDYLDGLYDDEDLSPRSTGPIPKSQRAGPMGATKSSRHVQDTGIGKTKFDEIYEKIIGFNRYRVYTTNVTNFAVYISDYSLEANADDGAKRGQNGQGKSIEKARNKVSTENKLREKIPAVCDHCRQEIEQDFLVAPMHYKHDSDRLIVFGEYIACRFGCARAIAQEQRRLNPLSTKYKNSEQILNYLAIKMTGLPAPPPTPRWDALAPRGSMDKETYYNSEKEFIKDPNIVFAPVKSQWIVKVD
jgi:hypothetical protein